MYVSRPTAAVVISNFPDAPMLRCSDVLNIQYRRSLRIGWLREMVILAAKLLDPDVVTDDI